MFKGLGNLGNMLKQAQEMGGRVQEINGQLQAERILGVSGGGMVEIEMNGLGEALSVKIDPALVSRQETEMIEELVRAAINQGKDKAKELHASKMQELAEGVNLPIPGVQEAISKLMNHTPNADDEGDSA